MVVCLVNINLKHVCGVVNSKTKVFAAGMQKPQRGPGLKSVTSMGQLRQQPPQLGSMPRVPIASPSRRKQVWLHPGPGETMACHCYRPETELGTRTKPAPIAKQERAFDFGSLIKPVAGLEPATMCPPWPRMEPPPFGSPTDIFYKAKPPSVTTGGLCGGGIHTVTPGLSPI